MSGISKRVSGSWVSGDYGIMGTSTDTITTLPAVLYPNAATATVGLKGNTVQNGTPTPDNPIMPQGTGERTENLFDAETAYGVLYNNGVISGELTALTVIKNSFPAELIGQQVTISVTANAIQSNRAYIRCSIDGSNIDSNAIAQGNTGTLTVTITPTSTSDKWWFTYGSGTGSNTFSNLMLNLGSTPLPYEKYGYKIPISSASTTTPVYLGEVESTRRIRELVLGGDENWNVGSANYYTRLPSGGRPYSTALCTHAKNATTIDNNGAYLYLQKSTFVFETLTDFKSYLQQQYANGTPVCVWYVLSTPQTAVVNEPLRKIGEYADEVSNITIPVTAGEDTLSVGTTLQPSEVTATYKGWHPVTNVHEYDSNYTIATMQALTIAQLQSHTIGDLEGGEWS